MGNEDTGSTWTDRYSSLGLVANPFLAQSHKRGSLGTALEVDAAANRLIARLEEASLQDAPKPILVSKATTVPNSYSLRAISAVERVLVQDDSMNMLHAYVQLYMMRRGRVRSTLGVVAERLAFHSFEQTLALYVEDILGRPDQDIASYEALGAEALESFAARFRGDPVGTVNELFGQPELERRPELAEVVDLRLSGLEFDEEESETSAEVDASIADAPGTGLLLAEEDSSPAAETDRLVRDYLVEHTRAHLSSVVARALRMYSERGLVAFSNELRITKAPRKTLAALCTLARLRFSKIAIVFDGFDNWGAIDPELRQTIVGTLSEMRWMLDGQAVFVFLLEQGGVPELEEQFGAGTHIVWDFPRLEALQKAPDSLDGAIVDGWLEAATRADAEPLTLEAPVLQTLAGESNGSLAWFIAAAAAAIEDAAERGLTVLDETVLESARAAALEPEMDIE